LEVDLDMQEVDIYDASIREHVAKSLAEQGVDAYSEITNQNANTDLWQVVADSSVAVKDEDSEGYRWTCVELVSPKYDFKPENLLEVKKVCNAMAGKYKYRVNTTTGVHVHVGDGDRGFPLLIMKRLVYVTISDLSCPRSSLLLLALVMLFYVLRLSCKYNN
jgi:hypothetical protein